MSRKEMKRMNTIDEMWLKETSEETLRRLEANRKERREEAKTAYEKALEEWEEMARIYTFKVMCNGDQELANRRFEELRDRLPSKPRITDFYAKYDPSRGIFEEAIQEDIFSEFFKDPQL